MAYSNGNGSAELNHANGDVANSEPIDKRKVFVGGLGPDVTEDDLKNYFNQFGNVQHAVVKRDPATGRSRCFAFVTFESSNGVKAVSAVSSHTLKNKKIDPKPAEPRPGEEPITKIFVGGIDPAMSEDELRQFFEKYGAVKNIEWPKDRMRDNAKKNFAFVEFNDDKVVADLLRTPGGKMTIGGRPCDVRKALPSQKGQQQFGAPGGGFGGGYSDPYSGYGGGYPGYGGGGYGAAAAAAAGGYGGYGDASSYYQGYDQSSYYGADPNAAAGAYAGYPGYDQSAYAGYDYGAAAGAPAAASYPPATASYPDPSANGSYAPRGGARGRGGMVGGRGAGGAMGGGRGAPGAAGGRGGARGYHPYRR